MTCREWNHASTNVLPYHVGRDGTFTFLLERKGTSFKAPYFNGGLNPLGGNADPSELDGYPLQIGTREIREEFLIQEERPESLDQIVGQPLQDELPGEHEYTPAETRQVQEVGGILLRRWQHLVDYELTVGAPVMPNHPLICLVNVFTRQLDDDEYSFISDTVARLGGKVTPDNRMWDGETAIINETNLPSERYAWACNHILSDISAGRRIDGRSFPTSARPHYFVSIRPLPHVTGTGTEQGPAYQELAALGYRFKGR